MADNFDMKQFLFENKLGSYARNTVVENQEEGYMGTQYGSSEDMAVDMVKKGITERYQPGDMWSTNFDYKGMLKAAANLSVSSPEELMQNISDSFEDVNYHRENSHLLDAIEAKKENDNDAIKFHLALFKDELKKTIKNLKETQIFEREKVEEGEAAYEYEKGKAAGEKEEEIKEAFKLSGGGAGSGSQTMSWEPEDAYLQKFANLKVGDKVKYEIKRGYSGDVVQIERVGEIVKINPSTIVIGSYKPDGTLSQFPIPKKEIDVIKKLKSQPEVKEDIGGDIGDAQAEKMMDFLAEKDKVKEGLPIEDPRVEQIIQTLKDLDVDGETMEYILKSVGMDDQMANQLVHNKAELDEVLSGEALNRMDGVADQLALADFRDNAYYVISSLREDGFDDEDILEFLQQNLTIAFR
jgi:hypothetical protein